MVCVFDIDGTLALIDSVPFNDPSKYAENCTNILVDERMAMIHNAMVIAGHKIIYCTGRVEEHRHRTEKWLRKNLFVPKDAILLMRSNGDEREDYVVKLEKLIPYKDKISCAFEDRDSVVKAFREAGITTLQVCAGSY